MPTYDAELFSPPAPVANVTLRNPDKGSLVYDVPMLIDSGADVSLIPHSAADQMSLTPTEGDVYELAGFDGQTCFARAVQLDLTILGRTFRGMYLILEREYGILGRDVLNRLSLLLNGPELTWSGEDPRRNESVSSR
jgi:hypothetical protein